MNELWCVWWLHQREQSVTQHIVLSDGTAFIPFPELWRPLTVSSIGQETSLMSQWLLSVSISLLSLYFTSFLLHLSFSSSKTVVNKTIRQKCFIILMFLFGIRRFIAPTRWLLLTFVTCYKFFCLFSSFLYKIPRYIKQGITSRVCLTINGKIKYHNFDNCWLIVTIPS